MEISKPDDSISLVSETRARKPSAAPQKPTPQGHASGPSLAGDFRYVKLSQLHQDPENLRKTYEDIGEFAAAIREDGGILNPLVVRAEGGEFLIIAGNRRYLAAQRLALEEVPVRVVDVTDDEKDALQISENINRSDVSAMELAQRIHRMIERYPKEDSTRIDKVAQRLSRTPHLVRQYLALLKLDPRVVKAIERNRLGISRAKDVLKLARDQKIDEAIALAASTKDARAKSGADNDEANPKPVRRTYEKRCEGFTVKVTFVSLHEAKEALLRGDMDKLLSSYGMAL